MRVTAVHWPELASTTAGSRKSSAAAPKGSHLVEEALKLGAQPIEAIEAIEGGAQP